MPTNRSVSEARRLDKSRQEVSRSRREQNDLNCEVIHLAWRTQHFEDLRDIDLAAASPHITDGQRKWITTSRAWLLEHESRSLTPYHRERLDRLLAFIRIETDRAAKGLPPSERRPPRRPMKHALKRRSAALPEWLKPGAVSAPPIPPKRRTDAAE